VVQELLLHHTIHDRTGKIDMITSDDFKNVDVTEKARTMRITITEPATIIQDEDINPETPQIELMSVKELVDFATDRLKKSKARIEMIRFETKKCAVDLYWAGGALAHLKERYKKEQRGKWTKFLSENNLALSTVSEAIKIFRVIKDVSLLNDLGITQAKELVARLDNEKSETNQDHFLNEVDGDKNIDLDEISGYKQTKTKEPNKTKQYGRVDLINGWSAVMDVDQDGHLNIFITNEDGSDISECETGYSDGENGELGLRYTTDNIEKKYHHENIVRWLQTNHKTWEAVVKDVTAIVWLTDDMQTFKTNLWWANGDSSYEGDYKCINKAKIACMRAIDKHEKENK
jgi:hypothetical protein